MARTDQFAKMIPCPEHPNGRVNWWDPRRHQAILFMEGSPYAGIWECPTGASDSCEHEERHIESVQVDYWPTPDIDRSYDVDVYVCDNCDVTIDRDVADPAEDRADYLADMQVMEALGK